MVIQMWNPLSEGGVVDSDSHNCWLKTFSEKESAEREDKKKMGKKKNKGNWIWKKKKEDTILMPHLWDSVDLEHCFLHRYMSVSQEIFSLQFHILK